MLFGAVQSVHYQYSISDFNISSESLDINHGRSQLNNPAISTWEIRPPTTQLPIGTVSTPVIPCDHALWHGMEFLGWPHSNPLAPRSFCTALYELYLLPVCPPLFCVMCLFVYFGPFVLCGDLEFCLFTPFYSLPVVLAIVYHEVDVLWCLIHPVIR